ncbi:MAG: M61 family metallopeptidase [Burkholderiales bacterium]|nr:M61 family metallopeptidase [Burkholderiales bacterium]
MQHTPHTATSPATSTAARALQAAVTVVTLALPTWAMAQPTEWPRVITLSVDATDLAHRVLRVQQSLPVAQPGQRLTLLYPRYLPGAHGPYGNVTPLAGLTIRAGEQRIAWTRDAADPHSFHVDVPAGVGALELSFQYLSPVKSGGDRVNVTPALLGVEWESVLLYPAGPASDAIRVQPRLRLPAGWKQAGAMRGTRGEMPQAGADGWVRFAPVSLETLVDSPLFAGPHMKRIELEPEGTPQPVALNLFADEASQLEASEAQINAHRALVQQATRLFGPRHWRQYDLLLALSDEFGGIGLEHHESSENGLRPDYFKNWDQAIRGRELLAHEFAHSWNGKFRRPADLLTPHYNTPMGTSLLWVYEGQTQFWGHVLAARAGLTTPEQARDRLAHTAAEMAARSGRAWRSLQDTTLDPAVGPGHSTEWEDWQRGFDYYAEGLLLWLDVDSKLREASGDQRSLDDFARAFFGLPDQRRADGSVQPLPYTFNDLVVALNAVQPLDWAAFLRERLDRTGANTTAPLDGLARSGWRLAWSDKESSFASHERGWSGPSGTERPQELAHSLGLRITSDGKLDQVFWQSPAFHAGLAPGMTLLAVNGRGYKPERVEAAITANRDGSAPLQLLVKDGDRYSTVRIDWRGGLRYPQLAQILGAPDRLSSLYKARP